jgi:hypothetical protein
MGDHSVDGGGRGCVRAAAQREPRTNAARSGALQWACAALLLCWTHGAYRWNQGGGDSRLADYCASAWRWSSSTGHVYTDSAMPCTDSAMHAIALPSSHRDWKRMHKSSRSRLAELRRCDSCGRSPMALSGRRYNPEPLLHASPARWIALVLSYTQHQDGVCVLIFSAVLLAILPLIRFALAMILRRRSGFPSNLRIGCTAFFAAARQLWNCAHAASSKACRKRFLSISLSVMLVVHASTVHFASFTKEANVQTTLLPLFTNRVTVTLLLDTDLSGSSGANKVTISGLGGTVAEIPDLALFVFSNGTTQSRQVCNSTRALTVKVDTSAIFEAWTTHAFYFDVAIPVRDTTSPTVQGGADMGTMYHPGALREGQPGCEWNEGVPQTSIRTGQVENRQVCAKGSFKFPRSSFSNLNHQCLINSHHILKQLRWNY